MYDIKNEELATDSVVMLKRGRVNTGGRKGEISSFRSSSMSAIRFLNQ